MHETLNSFTGAPERQSADGARATTANDSTCHHARSGDIELGAHCFQFVTLAFDRPQTAFRLPQWRWPLIAPYNGFSGGARIRGWQLMRFYRQNGWLRYDDVCSVTGTVGSVDLHNEDYSRPWTAYPVSKRAHTLIHIRARFTKAWAAFLASEALPDAWAKTLCPDGGVPVADRDCDVVHLLERAPHPAWVDLPEKEFDRR